MNKIFRKWRKVYAVILSMVLLLAGNVPMASAHGLGQWIWWNAEGDMTTHHFGANQEIWINTGKMQIIPYCPEGNPDGLTSWTDLYVVPTGSVNELDYGQELEDVSGAPNTVMSLSSGIFISELIGTTGPDGKIGPGTYDIIFDECQNGKFDPIDGIIDQAFTVEYTAGFVPPLDLSKMKEDAEKEGERWEKYEKWASKLFKSSKVIDAHNPDEKMVDFLMRSGLQDPRDAALLQLANQSKHYKGIAADPPDPNFQQIVPLGTRPVLDFQSDNALDVAMQNLATEVANEQAITQQLWTLLEKYQGAQSAGSVNWAMTHAKALNSNIDLLLNQLQRTNQSMSRFNQALSADPRPLTQAMADLEQLRTRISESGLTDEEIRHLLGLGFSDAEIDQFKSDFSKQDFTWTKNDMLQEGSAIMEVNNTFGTNLVSFGDQIVKVINQLLQDAALNDDDPVAKAGGPYSGTEGTEMTFNGSASTSKAGISKYEWDLDGDGTFGDAEGATVKHTFTKPFHGYIGLKVTDGKGNSSVDYADLVISNVNRPPVISTSTPADRFTELHIGESASFSLTATDPDGDALSGEWFVDGVSKGTGTSFTYNTTTDDAGLHRIEAVVTDASPLGGSARTGWIVQVLKPLPASIDLNPASQSLRVGTKHTLKATVLDDQSHEVSGLEVTLKITGANPATLTATTDDKGVATYSYTGSHEGKDNVTATAALLTSNKVDVTWLSADSIAPVTTAALSPATPDGSDGKYASPVTVTLSATDEDTGVDVTEYRVNGGAWKNYTGPVSIGADGTYEVEYRSRDNAGNEEAVKSASFTILIPVVDPDTAGPATSAAVNPAEPDGNGGWYISSPVTVTLNAKDDKSGVKTTLFSLDGGDWQDYSAPVTVSADGQHKLDFRSTDYAGNEEAVKSISFRIDSTKPGLSAILNPASPDGTNGWYVSPPILTVSASDGGSGLANTDYRTNSGIWQAYSKPIDFSTDGTYTVDVRAEDQAGNPASSQTVTVKLDRVKPVTKSEVNPTAPDGSDGNYASDVNVTLTAVDGGSNGSGLAKTEYRLDEGAWQTFGGTPITVSANGSHKVEYRSTDKAGNAEDTKSVSFIIDKTKAPQVFFNPQTGGRNVALLESGATVIAASSSYDGFHTPQAMLDYSTASLYPWATSSLTNQYVKFALAGGKTYLIDKVQIMPRIDYANQRVKDFEIAVSTTTTDNSAFTTVLKATTADNGNLQNFTLEKPVMAKYIMYRPLNTQGSSTVISTQQLKVNTGQEGENTVHFDNLTSVDSGATIVKWAWDFGDNQTSSEQSPTHTYGAPGTYKVTLTATDSNGKTGTYSLNQTVFEPAVADFSNEPEMINEGQSVTFTDTSVQPNGGRAVQRTWNWGDNTAAVVKDGAASSASVTHTFKDNGAYQVNLQILDDKGQSAQKQKTITVNNLPPTVTVTAKQNVKSGQSASFSPTIKDPGGDTFTCKWDFGDNTSSTQCSASHTYPTLADRAPDKTYTAKLTVTDKDGASVTFSADVVVYSPYINSGSAINDSDLYFSRYCAADNVRKLQFTYDGNYGFSMTTPQAVSKVGYADGLIFAPDGDLLTGGGSYVYKINRETGESLKQPAGATAYHLMLDKSGKKLWAAGIPGSLIEFPLDPVFGPGIVHNISGDENSVTSVAFDAKGNAYYTRSGADGSGTFGKIDLTTFKTTRLLSNLQAAHGMFFDSYTGHIIMDGGNQVLQYDPVAERVVSIYTSPVSVTFDQGAADGKGHILVASNSGHLLFLDYSESKEVGNPHNFTATPYVESCLDDVAPLSGFGSVPPASIDLTPSESDLTVGDTRELNALVKDTKGKTVAGYPVTLTVTGANAGTYTAISNADGIATFSYKGAKGGEDTAVATAGNVTSAQAKVNWRYPAAAVNLTPASATLIIGEEHQLKATVLDSQNSPKTGVTVNLEIVGANPVVLTGQTDANGEVTFSYKGEKAGVDTVTAKVTEGTKVLTSGPAAVTWKPSDTTPPVTTAEANAVDGPSGGWFHANVSLSLTATDEGSGVKSIEYRTSGGEWKIYTGPLSLTESGIYTYEYRSTDNDGNVETVKSVIVQLDKSAPVTLYHLDPIYSKNKLGQTYISGFNVSLRASDTSGSGVEKTYYRINGGAWQTYIGSFVVTAGVTHTVEYYTVDKAGNVEGPMNKMDFDRGIFTGAGKY